MRTKKGGLENMDQKAYEIAEKLVIASKRAYNRGIQTGSGGNVSARIPGTETMLVKASGGSLGDCTPEGFLITDFDGNVVEGAGKPTREALLHGYIYKLRPDVQSVVHVHSPYAIGWSSSKKDLPLVTWHSKLKNPEDYDSYFEDTMQAGHYENDKGAVEKMIKESPQIIQDLKDFGVRFDLKDGEIEFTREGGHSTFRILHHEDLTGKEITSHLYEEAKKRDNITIMENCMMIDIIEKDGECKGIVYKDQDGNFDTIEAPDTVLATGGLGGLFKHSTNFRHLTADSLAICLRHNVTLENINYIQIHPTTFYSKKPGRRFLISESVRGEGAYLLNKDGERFTDELQPRDVVTGEICKQMKKDGSDHVYLTVTHLDGERIKHRFPNIYKQCLDEGYDMTKEPIPVTPAQHYFMGGIKVNLDSKTSMDHLYAVGETSCNGVHGRNRLASNSLLESLVFAKAAAKDITEHPSKAETVEVDLSQYKNEEQREKENEQLVLDEIKRKDRSFYDQWCNDEN